MGNGMKFTIDETNTIILALEEHRATHCYNYYEDNYEWEQSHEKRWADEINGLIKRFKKSAKLKELYERAQMKERIYTRLKDSGLYEDIL